jgi:hypothetical protein
VEPARGRGEINPTCFCDGCDGVRRCYFHSFWFGLTGTMVDVLFVLIYVLGSVGISTKGFFSLGLFGLQSAGLKDR